MEENRDSTGVKDFNVESLEPPPPPLPRPGKPTGVRYSNVESLEAARAQVIHSAVGKGDVVFLDLGDDFDSISALKLNGYNKIQAGTKQLGH